MKKTSVIFYIVLVFLVLPMSVYGQLVVWSFTDELKNMIDSPRWGFKATHPGVTFEYSQTPSNLFQSKIDPVLASGRGAPDIITLESSFVRKYVESGLLLDLTDIYEANKSKLLAYPVDVGTYNGKVYALSWQASPGAMFYRRSLAKKYLGTDDPKTVQSYFSDFNKFLETARLLNQKSNGSCVAVSSLNDLLIPFLAARKTPWIVNGKLVIDPVMTQYMDICKTLHDNGMEGGVEQWSEAWFNGMKGNFRDKKGKSVEVFSYFLPTWGLPYVLKSNAPNTAGDWAMIQGPSSYRWGGTWIGAYKGTKNIAAVKEFIRYATTDDVFLETWAKSTGDIVSSINVINKIKGSFSEPYLGGQNHYAEFAEMAKNVNGKLFQKTDEAIEDMFDKAVSAYVNGEKTKAQALADYFMEVRTATNADVEQARKEVEAKAKIDEEAKAMFDQEVAKSGFQVTKKGTGVVIDKYIGDASVVEIPSSIQNIPVIEIGNKAFMGCTKLTSVNIPDNVTSIGYQAFDGCKNLASVTISNSVTSIGTGTFQYCTSLTNVTFATGSNITNENFGNIAFPEGKDGRCGNTLKSVYATGKAGTYTRAANGTKWTKN